MSTQPHKASIKSRHIARHVMDEHNVLHLFADDAKFFVENLVKPLESPEKEAPHLYQAIKRNITR